MDLERQRKIKDLNLFSKKKIIKKNKENHCHRY